MEVDKPHKVVKDSKKIDWVKPELVVLGLRETADGTALGGAETSDIAASKYSPSGKTSAT